MCPKTNMDNVPKNEYGFILWQQTHGYIIGTKNIAPIYIHG